MMNVKTSWFSVRCIFRQERESRNGTTTFYEERLTVWCASSFEEAIAKAEREAEEYAADSAEYLGFAQAYLLPGDLLEGEEVFSLIRSSSLEPAEYLETSFEDGHEREDLVEQCRRPRVRYFPMLVGLTKVVPRNLVMAH